MTEWLDGPLFSLVMPAHNAGATIERAVLSVISQTETSWELIVVDDCSTDSTLKSVVGLSELHPGRIRVVRHTRNLGVAAARNSGIQTASGRFIAFVDSDDECLPHYLSTFKSEFDDATDVVLAGREIVGTDGSTTTASSRRHGEFTGQEAMRLGMLDDLTPFPWDKAFRRSVFDTVRFPSGLARFEDMMVNLAVYSRSRKVRSIDRPVYRYFIGAQSLTWGRLPTIDESSHAISFLLNSVHPSLVVGKLGSAFEVMRNLMLLLTAQTALIRGGSSQDTEKLIKACRQQMSWHGIAFALLMSPRLGAAAALFVVLPGAYSALYRRHVRRLYGNGLENPGA